MSPWKPLSYFSTQTPEPACPDGAEESPRFWEAGVAITTELLFWSPVQIAIIPSSKMQSNLLRKKVSVETARGQGEMMDRLSDSIDI